jgi:hypothetical protein
MLEWWSAVADLLPWWLWLLVALAAAVGFHVAGMAALAVISAAGTHHDHLTSRQRRMARYASKASLAALTLAAATGAFALLTAGLAALN